MPSICYLRTIYFRFPDILSIENLKSTWLHPMFRNQKLFRALEENARMKNLVISELVEELQKTPLIIAEVQDSKTGSAKPEKNKGLQRYLQDSSDEEEAQEVNSDAEVIARKKLNSYLDSSAEGSTEMLKDHPTIARLFLKYNTTLRSCAPSERLFSMAKYVFRSNRMAIGDRNFEKQLLIKSNGFSFHNKMFSD